MAPLLPHEWNSFFAIRSAALEQWRKGSVGLGERKDKLCEHLCISGAVWHTPIVEVAAELQVRAAQSARSFYCREREEGVR